MFNCIDFPMLLLGEISGDCQNQSKFQDKFNIEVQFNFDTIKMQDIAHYFDDIKIVQLPNISSFKASYAFLCL